MKWEKIEDFRDPAWMPGAVRYTMPLYPEDGDIIFEQEAAATPLPDGSLPMEEDIWIYGDRYFVEV